MARPMLLVEPLTGAGRPSSLRAVGVSLSWYVERKAQHVDWQVQKVRRRGSS
jgi:hypothetical protein